MELKTYLVIIKKNSVRIIVSALLVGLVVYVVSGSLPISYEATISVYIQKVPENFSQELYTYDGFYAQEAAESYTDTVVGLFESPAITEKVVALLVGLDSELTVKSVSRKVMVEKSAPRIITIRVKDNDQEVAIQTASALFKAADESIKQLHGSDDPERTLQIAALNSEPLIARLAPFVWLNTLVGALVGLIGALCIVALREYLKE